VVTPWFPTADAPESGLFVAREVDALAEAHEVDVLHLDWNGDRDREPVPSEANIRRLWLRRTRPLDYLRARRAVRRASEQVDVVHTHALTGLVPWIIGRPARRGWVHSEHWSALSSPQTRRAAERLAVSILARLLRRPSIVIAESTRLADAIRRTRTGPVVIVPCVVPSVPVTDPPPTLRLVGIGGMNDRKDPVLAVETLAELRRRGHDAQLTWVGDGPLRGRVATRATELGVGEHIVLTGRLPSEQVSQRLDDSSALLLPTRGDNFCVVAAEALVHGRPIVSGAETGAVDYAPAEVSRFVVSREPSAYADAVESVMDAVEGLSAQSVASLVAGRFTPAVVRSALEEIYTGVVGR